MAVIKGGNKNAMHDRLGTTNNNTTVTLGGRTVVAGTGLAWHEGRPQATTATTTARSLREEQRTQHVDDVVQEEERNTTILHGIEW